MLVRLGLILVVGFTIVLLLMRFVRPNTLERSIDRHRRQLDTIDEVVQRAAEHPPIVTRPLTSFENAGDTEFGEVRRAIPMVPPQSAVQPHVSESPRRSPEGRLLFGDLSQTPVVPPTPPIYERGRRRGRSPRRPARSPQHIRRRSPLASPWAQGAIAALLLVVAAGAVVRIGHSHRSSLAIATTTTTSPTKVTKHHLQRTTPPAIELLSTSATSATYSEPLGSFRITVQVLALCWLGFAHQRSTAGPWFAMTTIGPYPGATYALSTTGPLTIDVGAPQSLTSISVNGRVLTLPHLPTGAFAISFG
jgi:hypothetical protein